MNIELLAELSNADSVASDEDEVRNIIRRELADYSDAFCYDGIGSLIVTKKSKLENAPTVLFSAHMDEVGFLVRNISDLGFLYLIPLGAVLDKSKENQLVRVTTDSGDKYEGILNVTKNAQGQVEQTYVDLGFETQADVEAAGIQIGDMVVFASEFRAFKQGEIYAGKAMDDRISCFTLIEAMKELENADLAVNVVAAFTSSEEVGTRGGKLTSAMVKPDIFFAVDVANHPELDRSFMNHRKIGFGPMLEYYDKGLAPNRKLIKHIEKTLKENDLPYQKDMFKNGGTDAGLAHLENSGTLASVLGIPLRYCHSPYSIVNIKDAEVMKALIIQITKSFSAELIAELHAY
ncbi:MAG: aminopeptidase [Streptococcaceae bacterium]|jgi:putative aminopeptidase FrvX|nr:aminopeptidase [Streptococcaceae bacterium]